ncbi:MAG: diguanylate cyclase [Gaiellaceae bacterium]|nr:diguanylate cyclase [Gaiellaceae bacterium]
MTLLPAVAIAVLVTWALGGTMSRLGALSFRATATIYLAVAAQLVIFSPLAEGNDSVVRFGQLGSYCLVLAFLHANRRIRGMWVVALGVTANTLAIAANGGLMPVDPEAAQASGWQLDLWANGSYHNTVLATAHTHLAFLGDIIALPSSPITAAVSVGDLLLMAGAFVVVYRACCADERAGSGRAVLVAPLRLPAFRSFVLLQLTSATMAWLAAATMVAWAYTHVGGLAASTGVLLLRGLAGIAAPWVGGRLADRSGPTAFLFQSQFVQAFLLAGAALAMYADAAVPAYILFALGSLAAASGDTAARAVVVASVDRHDALLPAANGLLGTARGLAMAGGALGAGIFASVADGTTLVFAAAAAAAAVGGGYVNLHRLVTPGPADAVRRTSSGRTTPWRIQLVLPMIAMFAIATLATGLVNAALPQILGEIDASLAYGIGIGAIGVGLLVGQALGAILPAEQIRSRTIVLALVGMAAAVALAGSTLVATTLIVALLALGLFDGVTETVFDTILQRAAPEHVHGRVFGVAHTVCTAAMMTGFAVAPVFSRIGWPSLAMTSAAAVLCVAAVLGAVLRPRPLTAASAAAP